MEIFTRGSDRFWIPPSSEKIFLSTFLGHIIENFAFAGADALWRSFQERIVNYVIAPEQGGEANTQEPVTLRPPFKEAMLTLLKEESPILQSAKATIIGLMYVWICGGIVLSYLFSWVYTSIVFKLINHLKERIENHWKRMTTIILGIYLIFAIPFYLYTGLPNFRISSFALPSIYFASSYFLAYLIYK